MSEKTTIAISAGQPKDGDISFITRATDHGLFVDDLQSRGLSLVVTSKASFEKTLCRNRWLEASTSAGELILKNTTASPGDIHAVYSRIVGPQVFIDRAGVPQLNSTPMKIIGASKSNMIGSLGHLEIPTYAVSSVEVDALDLYVVEDLVLKPSRGREGKGVQKVKRSDLLQRLTELFEDGDAQEHMLQPNIGVGKIPEGTNGINVPDQLVIEAAKKHGIPAEIRLFVIKNGQKLTTVPLMRIASENMRIDANDTYVDVELSPEVESQLASNAESIINRFAALADETQHVIAAVDYLFDGDSYWVVEANLRTPELPLTRQSPHSARRIYPAIADTLYSMSEGGK